MKQLKPYLFILGFLALPLLLIPIIRKASNNFMDSSTIQGVDLDKTHKYGLIIHGGAGNISKENTPDSIATIYTQQLNNALNRGYQLIDKDSSAVYVVTEVIRLLEDSPFFNAGKGSVLNAEGVVEMDASIMDGQSREAGAVSGVHKIKNPIKAAYRVLTHSKHVLLTANGAEKFAKEQKLTLEQPDYFITRKQQKRYLKSKIDKFGTVGCVVLDKKGNISAGTSTGGMANKQYGRVGDSPIIGAGTYADNKGCGVSCTGHGEYFMRLCVAYQVSSRMQLLHEPISKACSTVLNEISDIDGSGGIIALDAKGNYSIQFNTPGMFRGVYIKNGNHFVKLFQQ